MSITRGCLSLIRDRTELRLPFITLQLSDMKPKTLDHGIPCFVSDWSNARNKAFIIPIIIALVTHYCEWLWPTFLNYSIQEIRCDCIFYYLGSLVLTQAKPFANSLSVNIFLQSFVKWSEIANGRLCSTTKLKKQCLSFNDLIIEGTASTGFGKKQVSNDSEF